VPHRGKTCEPALSATPPNSSPDLRGETVEHLAETTTRNFFALFSKAAA
jgi:TatD DNase family protein